MIQICAWCQHENQQGNHEQIAESPLEQISHGICQEHARHLRRTYRRNVVRETNPTSLRHLFATSVHP